MKTLKAQEIVRVMGGFHVLVREDFLEEDQLMVRVLMREDDLDHNGLVVAGGTHYNEVSGDFEFLN